MYHQYYGNTRENAKQLRKNMTPWERKLWYDFLRTYCVRFRRQVVICGYIVDFCCNTVKLIVELDGGGHFTDAKQKYDSVRTDKLQQEGYMVVRISNFDVTNNFYGVCSFIDRIVKRRINPSAYGSSPQKGSQECKCVHFDDKRMTKGLDKV